ncbi:MAG: hypothetical protein ACRDUS_19090 [Mycobacterium sp.]
MTTRRRSLVLAGFTVIAVTASGCGKPAETPSTPAATSTATSETRSAPAASPAAIAPSRNGVMGTGNIVGTAVLKVSGDGQATVTWKENGGPAHVEKNVSLPWEHTIDVIAEASSEIRADGTGTTGCTITMGTMLVSFKNEPNPVCEFAYWG